ncbi:hypothetical protein PMIN06_001301 [Paraphaeosphaeria minitans]
MTGSVEKPCNPRKRESAEGLALEPKSTPHLFGHIHRVIITLQPLGASTSGQDLANLAAERTEHQHTASQATTSHDLVEADGPKLLYTDLTSVRTGSCYHFTGHERDEEKLLPRNTI